MDRSTDCFGSWSRSRPHRFSVWTAKENGGNGGIGLDCHGAPSAAPCPLSPTRIALWDGCRPKLSLLRARSSPWRPDSYDSIHLTRLASAQRRMQRCGIAVGRMPGVPSSSSRCRLARVLQSSSSSACPACAHHQHALIISMPSPPSRSRRLKRKERKKLGSMRHGHPSQRRAP
jgi:hypothetical protein